MKKRVLAMVMVLVMALSLLPVPAGANGYIVESSENTIHTGTIGDNINWAVNEETGTLTISGEGDMEDYPTYGPGWQYSEYIDIIKTIIIEPGVTSIGRNAFKVEYENVTKLIVSESVTEMQDVGNFQNIRTAGPSGGNYDYEFGWTDRIADNAFASSYLQSVILPSTIRTIGERAFNHCGISTVTFPYGLETIGAFAFQASDIEYIVLPEGVTLEEYAFSDCDLLNAVYLPNDLSEVPNHLFYNCSSLKSISIPYNVTSIGDWSFANTSIELIVIPKSVKSIGEYAFHYCDELTSVTLPEGLQIIGGHAFENCSAIKQN